MFWPLLRPELIFYLLESLTEHKIPFVYAWASPMAFISEDVQKMIDTNPDCCVVKFAPQWQVLEHDAIKFFLVSRKRFDSITGSSNILIFAIRVIVEVMELPR